MLWEFSEIALRRRLYDCSKTTLRRLWEWSENDEDGMMMKGWYKTIIDLKSPERICLLDLFVVHHAGGWWHMLAVCLVYSVSMSLYQYNLRCPGNVTSVHLTYPGVTLWLLVMSPSLTGRGSMRGCLGQEHLRPSGRGGGCGRPLTSMTTDLCPWRRSLGYVLHLRCRSWQLELRILSRVSEMWSMLLNCSNVVLL